jgi:hypothetical protein
MTGTPGRLACRASNMQNSGGASGAEYAKKRDPTAGMPGDGFAKWMRPVGNGFAKTGRKLGVRFTKR